MFYESKSNKSKHKQRQTDGIPPRILPTDKSANNESRWIQREKKPSESRWVPRNKKSKPPRKKGGCLSLVIRLAFFLLVIGTIAVAGSGLWVRMNFFAGSHPELKTNDNIPVGYTHVLLLGEDNSEGTSGRGLTDSIMIASFGDGGDIRLVSVMRDMIVDMGQHGEHKINAAYKLGGGKLAMTMINQSFGLDVTRYAVVNFEGIAKIIDAMGGIELTITEAERDQINLGLRKAYQKKRVFNGVLMQPLTEYGDNIHMSGTHAMFYARIRIIDSDYRRAERQRILLKKMIDKLRANPNPIVLGKLAAMVLTDIDTNLNPMDCTALLVRGLSMRGDMRELRLPTNDARDERTENGIFLIRADFKKCRAALYKFFYAPQ